METIIKNENEQECIRREYYGMMDLRKIFVGYGRWLEQRNIPNQGSIQDYETYLTEGKIIKNENLINTFVDRLKTGQYKVILYNKQTPITVEDLEYSLVYFILEDINEDTEIELINNKLIIHNEDETIQLTGYKEMKDSEIIARKYLDRCKKTLVVKDYEMQVEMREDNFKNVSDYYSKCKDIVDIDIFIGDESDPVWRMNWDAIWVTYRNGKKELWQRE